LRRLRFFLYHNTGGRLFVSLSFFPVLSVVFVIVLVSSLRIWYMLAARDDWSVWIYWNGNRV
jgi:hypothetical protein